MQKAGAGVTALPGFFTPRLQFVVSTLIFTQMQVYRIRPSHLLADALSRLFEVVPFMSFTRRQILTGIAGLAVVGLGAGGASRSGWGVASLKRALTLC